MNKYIVRTSLVWAGMVAALVGVMAYRSHRATPSRPSEAPEVLASGPEAQVSSVAPSRESASPAPDAALAPVQMSGEQMRAIGVQTATAEYKRTSAEVRATGTVAVDERLLSYVQVRFSGYVRKVFADATYQYIRKGQPLFTIYSPELVATEREYLLAQRNQQALSHSTVEGVAEGAATLARAAEQRLKQWDIPASEIAKMSSSGNAITDLTIYSEVSGYITERNAVPNLAVEPSTRLYTVADLSTVWVDAQVFQEDVGSIRPGGSASISVDAYPGATFHAHVEQILPQVDAATRTVQVRLSVQNPAVRLKPGMYVNVLLKSAAGEELTIPSSAVLETGARQVVFVDNGNGSFAPREVVAGPSRGGDRVVLSGLHEHERVVTSANFLLDSESQLQAAAGATATTTMTQSSATTQRAQSSQAASIAFATTPNPPHKGPNSFRVDLRGGDGKPLDGAEVTVTFYMPAMPAMGMAAMKTTSTLSAKGGGVYEGTGDLGSGGSWQVTVVASQQGRTVAMKQLRVNAAGGM